MSVTEVMAVLRVVLGRDKQEKKPSGQLFIGACSFKAEV